MKQAGGGMDILKIALIAGGGYLLYTKFLQPQTATGATGGGSGTPPAGGGSAPPAGSSGSSTPPAGSTGTPPAPSGSGGTLSVSDKLIQDLTAAANGDANFIGGKGTADQWNYYRNQLRPPALSGEQFGAAFPGMTATDRGPTMTAAEFVAKLAGANVGLGAVLIPVPIRANVNGQNTLIWGVRPGGRSGGSRR